MIVLIDTDVLLDIALMRKDFYKDSMKIIDLAEDKKISGFIAWHTLSNLYNLTSSASKKGKSKEFINDLLEFIQVANTNTSSAIKAVKMDVPDFEDALQISSAIECNANYIITRNIKHYRKSIIKAVTPTQFLSFLK